MSQNRPWINNSTPTWFGHRQKLDGVEDFVAEVVVGETREQLVRNFFQLQFFQIFNATHLHDGHVTLVVRDVGVAARDEAGLVKPRRQRRPQR